MSSSMYRQKRWLHISLLIIAFVILMMCHFSVRLAFPQVEPRVVRYAAAALLVVLAWIALHTLRIATQYVESFYDLTTPEAWQLVKRSLIGLRRYPPVGPSLRVADGQADPEGSVILHEIGGPGYLSVDHNNVAITQRLGKLDRIWEPGFDSLEPYERVWDVVDIRPQHRTLRVDFMTRDGIPAHCDVEMTFKVAETFGPQPERRERWVGASLQLIRRTSEGSRKDEGRDPPSYADIESPEDEDAIRGRGADLNARSRPQADKKDRDTSYAFSKEAVLNLVRSKFVTSSTDPQAVSDWITGITRGALDGAIRDELEKYGLDQFLDPIDTLAKEDRIFDAAGSLMREETSGEDGGDEDSGEASPRPDLPNRRGQTSVKKPLHDLTATITEEVAETANSRGIQIENLELTELQPNDNAISQQWLDTWRARVQKELDQYRTLNRLERMQATERIRVEVRARLITRVLDRFETLSGGGHLSELSAGLIITEFLAVLESMCGQGPEMQRLAFQQSESLIRVINAIQKEDSPFGQPGVSPSEPPSDDELDLWFP